VSSQEDLRRAADAIRKVVAQSEGLSENSRADAGLRERLELAADVLDDAGRRTRGILNSATGFRLTASSSALCFD